MRLGITYDANTSSLKTASQGQGGFEFSLIYIYKRSTEKPLNCPKFQELLYEKTLSTLFPDHNYFLQ